MNVVAVVAQMLVRLTGVILVILGLLFWTGNALNMLPLHIWAGFILVLSFWVLAIVAGLAGLKASLVLLAILWGLFVVYFGLTQAQILPGPAHWVIEVLHFVVGIGTVGLGERLGARIKQARSGGVQA